MIRCKLINIALVFILFYYIIYEYFLNTACIEKSNNYLSYQQKSNGKNIRSISFNKNVPIIIISGIPGSGLELMQSIISKNGQLNCVHEKLNLISNLIAKRNEWTKTKIERERLKYAGMSDDVIDSAMTNFILQVLIREQFANLDKKEIGKALCQSNPYIIRHFSYIKKLLPNVKLVFMIRDPRSTITHLIKNKIEFEGVNNKAFKQGLLDWNRMTKDIYYYCQVYKKECLPVLYEQLVLQPKKTVRQVMKFLNMENHLNETALNNIFIEHNIDKKNLNQLFYWWKPYFPSAISDKLNYFAPFMYSIGYDPIGNNFNFSFHSNNFFN